ncbi:TetR/AcrR family transcriptional regulator [Pseudonocardia broussonetiae]|uniref:TetR/AcrR family transcriptional regulator n=1 Tax=Pseudonocardia broussonetiae TaxID=2736640 RepID=A0A6M6JMA1_9PSEU|nr:TetR/AcrR family transcriptional regulator [Pseudonocardia broussonetiae]QJY47549.1 TetR/AcrR family transcriptional regulator [Pseudonocardia broussonetiae]
MDEPVKTPTGRDRASATRIAATEAKVVAAAARLFVERGYAGTTLADVAAAAGVGARTVYVRFGGKAELLGRVVDQAVVGDAEPVDVLGRDRMRTALTAPTAAERLAAHAAAAREIVERAGALFAVAQQAAAVEPLIAGFWEQARAHTRHASHAFWTRLAQDGLLPGPCDVEALADTATVLVAAETYLLTTRLHGWTPAQYEAWLLRTTTALAGLSPSPTAPTPTPHPG